MDAKVIFLKGRPPYKSFQTHGNTIHELQSKINLPDTLKFPETFLQPLEVPINI